MCIRDRAYLPQPQIGESFSSKVAFDVQGPAQYADLIFDKIEEIVSKKDVYKRQLISL